MCRRTISALTAMIMHRRRWTTIVLSSCQWRVDSFLDALVDVGVSGNDCSDGDLLKIREIEIRGMYNIDQSVTAALGRVLMASQSFQLINFTLSIATLSAPSMKSLLSTVSLNDTVDTRDRNGIKSALKSAMTIKSIRLSCCTLDSTETVSILAQLLERLDALESLRIDSCRVADDDMATLLNAMKCHKQLREIFIPYNKCKAATMHALSDLLQKCDCALQTLDCSRQLPVDNGSDHDDEAENDEHYLPMDYLLPSLEKNTSLLCLDLSYSKIRSPDWIRMIELYLGSGIKNTSAKTPTSNSSSTALQGLVLCGVPIPQDVMWLLIATLPRCNPRLHRFWITGGIVLTKGSTRTTQSPSVQDPKHPSRLAPAFVDAVRENCSLHDILLPPSFPPVLRRYVQYYTDLNRGGRSLLRRNESTSVSAALWPLVLERAGRRTNYTNSDRWIKNGDRPDLEERRLNVCFHLLRNRILLEAESHSIL